MCQIVTILFNINQLSELQRLLIREERYEEADKIGKIIKDEEIKLGIRK